jgi:hypothetical protein
MNYLQLFDQFNEAYFPGVDYLVRELYDEEECQEWLSRPREEITKSDFEKIISILNRYGIYDESPQQKEKGKIYIDQKNYRKEFNRLSDFIIIKLQDDWWILNDNVYYATYLCDTFEGLEELIKSQCHKKPTRFNKIKSRINKFLDN